MTESASVTVQFAGQLTSLIYMLSLVRWKHLSIETVAAGPARYNDTGKRLVQIAAFQCGERTSNWTRAVLSIVMFRE